MSIVYEVTLRSRITIDYKNSGDVDGVIDVTAADRQELKIDISGSYFDGNQESGSKGLSFRWKCDTQLQSYCDEWVGSPVIEIPYDVIKGVDLVGAPVNITAQAYAIEASSSLKDIPRLMTNMTKQFKWSNVVAPRFSISLPNNKQEGYVLVSR